LESASFIEILKICMMHGWGASFQGFLNFFFKEESFGLGLMLFIKWITCQLRV
jgi:hypothetical protein